MVSIPTGHSICYAENSLEYGMGGKLAFGESPTIGYFFGDYELDVVRGCLLREGQELPLRYQSFQLLLYFVEHPATLISKDELTAAIWSDTSVTDNALVQCVTEIRRELNDDPRNPRFIKTFPKVGYRFIADVRVVRAEPGSTTARSALLLRGEKLAVENAGAQAQDSHASRWLLTQRHVTWILASALLIALVLLIYVFGLGKRLGKLVSGTTQTVSGLPTLAVFPLANGTGRQDMDWLREGLSDMILTDLAHTGKWNVLSREKMDSLVDGGNRSNPLPPAKALEIARSVHATNYIVGSISAAGQQVTTEIEIHDGQDGHLVATGSASLTDPLQIVAEAGRLSAEIARRLGFSGMAAPTLADAMTSNVDAYRYYSLGVEKAEQFQNTQAVALFKKAVKLDPKFAMAYARIGYAYAVQDFQPETGRPYLEQAQRLSASLPPMNRLYIEAWSAIAHSNYDAAIGILRQITQQYPDETEATCQLSRVLRGQERLDEAAALLRHGIQVNPKAKDLYNVYGLILVLQGHSLDGIRAYRQYVALAPQNPNGHDSLGMAYQAAGQYDAALAEYNQALSFDPEFEPSIVHLGDTYYQMGRYREALRQYHHYIEVTASSDAKALGYGDIATIYLTLGNLTQAQAAVAQEVRYNRAFIWHSLAVALEKHQKERVAALQKQLFANLPDAERGSPRGLRQELFYRGTIDLKTGNAQGAITHFQSALRHLPISSGIDFHEDCLANAYLELGMPTQAIAEYQRILKLNLAYPLAYFHLGQAYQQMHQQQQSAAAFQHFLQANPTADQDSPAMIEARRGVAGSGH
jgi:tetratricopeptide (TPR) repeat protein/DNA-binding winged helix-turn-helix (wHTH) protein